jgi:hypothetical protein
MGGTPDNKRAAVKPYLITPDEEGGVRLAVRDTRYNGQGYPIVTTTELPERFKTANAARAHAREHYGAQPGEFATK